MHPAIDIRIRAEEASVKKIPLERRKKRPEEPNGESVHGQNDEILGGRRRREFQNAVPQARSPVMR